LLFYGKRSNKPEDAFITKKNMEAKMAKKIIIDEDLCEGCETCVELCPDVFELGENGKARVKNSNALDTCNIEEAVGSCPAGALKLEE
jgi:ferredoxin